MIVAVDTGGTKTLIGIFTKEGKLLHTIKFPTPQDPEEYISTLAKKLAIITAHTQISVVSVASPGVIKDGIITWAGGNLSWKNLDIPKLLAPHIPNVPVIVENDASLGGLGETKFLKPLPPTSLYITISTGIGTGVISNGHLTGLHSESGHLLLEFDGIIKEWEDFASGKAIHEVYGKYAKDINSKRVWHQIADRISRGFLVLIPVLQPEIIIVGGSIGTYFDKYKDTLEGMLKERLPEHIPCPPIVQAKHPETAVIYGAYFHAIDLLTSHKI